MDATTLTAYLVSVTTVTTVLVQMLKQTLIDPHLAESTARDTLIRAVNIVLNVAGLCFVLAAHGQFDASQWLTYVTFVAMQSTGSHVLYQMVSAIPTPQAAPAPPTAPSAPPTVALSVPESPDSAL